MTKWEGPLTDPLDDISHIASKLQELDRWGEDLYANRRPDLVSKAAEVLGLEPTDSIKELALNVKEDVAVMHNGVLEAICFCYPSSWIPGERVGQSFAELHTPVADGDQLRRVAPRIAEMMATQGSFRRYVWTISTTGELSNHPNLSKPPVLDSMTVDDFWFRMETQTTAPLGDNLSSLFLVKVETCPLQDFWQDLDKRSSILASINSMTDAVLDYKNLAKTKEILNRLDK